MSTGTVKWFNDQKGFGFIQPDEPDALEVFLHFTQLQTPGKRIEEGDRVSYTLFASPRGPLARKVTKLD